MMIATAGAVHRAIEGAPCAVHKVSRTVYMTTMHSALCHEQSAAEKAACMRV